MLPFSLDFQNPWAPLQDPQCGSCLASSVLYLCPQSDYCAELGLRPSRRTSQRWYRTQDACRTKNLLTSKSDLQIFLLCSKIILVYSCLQYQTFRLFRSSDFHIYKGCFIFVFFLSKLQFLLFLALDFGCRLHLVQSQM